MVKSFINQLISFGGPPCSFVRCVAYATEFLGTWNSDMAQGWWICHNNLCAIARVLSSKDSTNWSSTNYHPSLTIINSYQPVSINHRYLCIPNWRYDVLVVLGGRTWYPGISWANTCPRRKTTTSAGSIRCARLINVEPCWLRGIWVHESWKPWKKWVDHDWALWIVPISQDGKRLDGGDPDEPWFPRIRLLKIGTTTANRFRLPLCLSAASAVHGWYL